MSLVVWLPLNGDLTNQGLSNVTVTNNGATVDNNGKIGKCYSFDSSKRITVSQPANLSTTAASLSCWVNLSSWGSTYDSLINLSTGTGWVDTRLAFVRNNTANRIGFCIANGSTYNFTVMTSDLPLNTWTHLTGTFDGSTIKIYVNGVLNNSAATTFNTLVYDSAVLNLGSWSNANNYPINGKLNDVRVYSHCLSAKEVKDLAKGLVLHYRLAGPGQENLVKNSNKKIISGDYAVTSYELSETLVLNQIYTITMKAKLTPDLKWIGIWSDGGGTQFADCQARNENNFYKWTVTCNSSNATHNIFTIFASNNNVGVMQGNTPKTGTCEIEWIKLEKGSIATPWCPNSADALYSTMGYNNNIEYDCSGYRRNGTKNGTITLDADSPRYTTSYKMGGTGTSIVGPSDFSHLNTFTYSCWFNRKTTENAYLIMGYQYGNNSSGSLAVSKNGFAGFHCYRFSTGDAETHIAGNINYNDGKWHMLTVTYENNIIKVYVDGIKTAEKNNISLLTSNRTFVINYPSDSINNSEYRDYKGLLSDARVYATALSAEDIAELYHSAVIVDNTSKNYAYEYFEA